MLNNTFGLLKIPENAEKVTKRICGAFFYFQFDVRDVSEPATTFNNPEDFFYISGLSDLGKVQLHNLDKIDAPPKLRTEWHFLHVETTRRFMLRFGRQEKRGTLISVDRVPIEISGRLRFGEKVNLVQEYYHVPPIAQAFEEP